MAKYRKINKIENLCDLPHFEHKWIEERTIRMAVRCLRQNIYQTFTSCLYDWNHGKVPSLVPFTKVPSTPYTRMQKLKAIRFANNRKVDKDLFSQTQINQIRCKYVPFNCIKFSSLSSLSACLSFPIINFQQWFSEDSVHTYRV